MTSLYLRINEKSTQIKPKNLAKFHQLARFELVETYLALKRLYGTDFQKIGRVFRFYGISIKVREWKNEKAREIKFKYLPTCQFETLMQHAARGTTLVEKLGKADDGSEDNLIRVLPAASKFFNRHEMEKYWGPEGTFEKFVEAAQRGEGRIVIAPKYDGSCIMAWDASDYLGPGSIRCTTLGAVDQVVMQGQIDDSPTFESLALQMLGSAGQEEISRLTRDSHGVQVLELCHRKWNPIVTKHKQDFIMPLYRVSAKGDPVEKDIDDTKLDNSPDGVPRLELDPSLSLEQVDAKIGEYINSLKGNDIVEDLPEGVVGYWIPAVETGMDQEKCQIEIPFVKIKTDDYRAAHGQVELNVGGIRSLHGVERDVCLGQDDDRVEQVEIDHAQKFRQFLETLVNFLQDNYLMDLIKVANNGRDYATIVKQYFSHSKMKWLQPFLFEMRTKFDSDADLDLYQVLTAWLVNTKKPNMPLTNCQELTVELEEEIIPWFSQYTLEMLRSYTQPQVESTDHNQNEHSCKEKNFNEKDNNEKKECKKSKETEPIKSKFIIVDLDKTSLDTQPPVAGYRGVDWWQDVLSLPVDIQVFIHVLGTVRAYVELGYQLVFMTGRRSHLRQHLKQILDKHFPDISYRLITTPGGESVRDKTKELPCACTYRFKKWVLSTMSIPDVGRHVDRLVFIDDDQRVLKEALSISFPFPSVIYQADLGKLNLYHGEHQGLIVLLSAPPGSGKTALIRHVMERLGREHGLGVVRFSMDDFKLDYFKRSLERAELDLETSLKTEQGRQQVKEIWREVMSDKEKNYQGILKIVNNAITSYNAGNVVFVDMVNQKADNFKAFKKVGCKVYMASLFPAIETKTKKGSIKKTFNAQLAPFCVKNILRRTITDHQDSTYLGGFDGPDEIGLARALVHTCQTGQACVDQVESREGDFLPSDLYPCLEEAKGINIDQLEAYDKFISNSVLKSGNKLKQIPEHMQEIIDQMDQVLRSDWPSLDRIGDYLIKQITAVLNNDKDNNNDTDTDNDTTSGKKAGKEKKSVVSKWQYMGVPVKRQQLLELISPLGDQSIPDNHKIKQDFHITVVPPGKEFSGSGQAEQLIKKYFGQPFNFEVVELVVYPEISFFKVKLMEKSEGSSPFSDLTDHLHLHITFSKAGGVEAKMSRELLENPPNDVVPRRYKIAGQNKFMSYVVLVI